MDSRQKRILAILVLISVIYFIVFIFPNNTGAKDKIMLSIFAGDEFAQYPVVIKMLTPRETFKQTLINFIEYRHYYYGSPFYFSSAFLLLPVKLVQGLENTQLNMLVLRQAISVFPMIAALLLLTFVQTKFQSYIKTIALFVILLSVSAVVKNNLWWHVDSLAVFFVALTFFLLEKDNLRFGRYFYLAAASIGLATGTKVLGFFFFLAIPTYLFIGILRKQLTWSGVLLRATVFVVIMTAMIVISNPFMIFRSEFASMIDTLTRQSKAMYEGWILLYDKGPASWLHIIEEFYGQLIFIALALIAVGLGIWRSENRVPHLLIAMWAIPFGLYVLFTIAIKPAHFFLPILLPVFSSLVVLFEFPPFNSQKVLSPLSLLWGGLVLTVIAYQFVVYVKKDVELYSEVLTREENEASIGFYNSLEKDYLSRIQTEEKLVVFRDVKVYFPKSPRWVVRTYWNSSYKKIENIKPDLIILWPQRILDYTQEGARESAVNPDAFQNIYEFYVDVNNDQLRGYRLIYRDEEGLFFVSDRVYEEFFK